MDRTFEQCAKKRAREILIRLDKIEDDQWIQND